MALKQRSFFANFKAISRLTKLYSCFFWNIPFSLNGLVENTGKKELSFCQRFCQSSILSRFIVPLISILIIAFAVVYAIIINYLSNNTSLILNSIAFNHFDDFVKYSLRFFGLVVLSTLLNCLLLVLGFYLFETRLRIYLTDVITHFYYLTLNDEATDVSNQESFDVSQAEIEGENPLSVHKGGFAEHAHFLLIHFDRDIEDPDVRINRDVFIFCQKLNMIIIGTPMYRGYLITIFNTIYFLVSMFLLYSWYAPVFVLVAFSITTVISLLLGSIAARVAARIEGASSYYERMHHFIAKNAEHIAFLHGEMNERERLAVGMRYLTKELLLYSLTSLLLNIFTILSNWSATFLAMIAPGAVWLIFNDENYTTPAMQSDFGGAVYTLVITMSFLVLLAQEWTFFIASTSRVSEMIRTLYKLGTTIKMEDEEVSNKDASSSDNSIMLPSTWRQAPLYAPLVVKDITLLQPSYMFAQQRRKLREIEKAKTGKITMFDSDDEDYITESKSAGCENNKLPPVLLRNISFSVGTADCHSVMIMGPSGVGKSTLLRVIAKLWPAVGGGYVEHPPTTIRGAIASMRSNPLLSRPVYGSGFMLFMPQRPYLTPGGSLAAQITYPLPPPMPRKDQNNLVSQTSKNDINDSRLEEILNLLRLLRLNTLLDRYDVFATSSQTAECEEVKNLSLKRFASKKYQTPADWSLILSHGELQRIGMARVLYHKPHIVVMDEATSAMDEDCEHIALTAIRQTRIPCNNDGNNTTPGQEYRSIHLLSVSHRSTVKPYHDWVLQISQDGTATLEKNADAKEF